MTLKLNISKLIPHFASILGKTASVSPPVKAALVIRVTAAGGATVFASGVKKYVAAEIHVDALHELNSSFEADLKPKIIEVEDRTVTLTGSAEAQYETWRRILRQIHIQETGL